MTTDTPGLDPELDKAYQEAAAAKPDPRETLGQVARQAFVAWANEQGGALGLPASSWDDLAPSARESYCRMAEDVAAYAGSKNAILWGTDCPACARLLDHLHTAESRLEMPKEEFDMIRKIYERIEAARQATGSGQVTDLVIVDREDVREVLTGHGRLYNRRTPRGDAEDRLRKVAGL